MRNANAWTLFIAAIVLVIANIWVFPNLIELPAATNPAPQSDSAKPAPSMNGTGILQGQLLKIDGDLYIVKDAGGKEVHLRVNKDTVLDKRIKAGDKVDVQMAADGHAATLLKALQ
ncbi:MAG: hypothetical protein A3H49_07520 [Nitrospirae bacterium RIFCSPLOWO2_02_FULL_62_14]|nr:MAG: hypothetical protein A3H49_07520 [Nitrospirae bacterium RIFCSPLOWO2_02_FULL_62_14]